MFFQKKHQMALMVYQKHLHGKHLFQEPSMSELSVHADTELLFYHTLLPCTSVQQENRPTGCTIFHLFSINPTCFSLTGCQWESQRNSQSISLHVVDVQCLSSIKMVCTSYVEHIILPITFQADLQSAATVNAVFLVILRRCLYSLYCTHGLHAHSGCDLDMICHILLYHLSCKTA